MHSVKPETVIPVYLDCMNENKGRVLTDVRIKVTSKDEEPDQDLLLEISLSVCSQIAYL